MLNKLSLFNRIFSLLICISWYCSGNFGQKQGPDITSDIALDEISINVPIDAHEEQTMQEIQTLARQVCSGIEFFTPAEIVQILTSAQPLTGKPILLQNLLQFDLYHKTYPILTRRLQSLPTLTLPLPCTNDWIFSVEPFYNFTKKMFFTPCSSQIGSYIDLLQNDDFLELLDQADFTNVDIPDVFSLFAQTTLEERRLGILLSSWINYDPWIGIISLPVYYFERNLFLSQQKRDALEQQGLFAGQGVLPGINFDTFTNQHLVSDKFGIGDLLIQAYYNFASPEYPFELGAEVSFPTAHIIKNGIIGGKFCKTCPIPLIDFKKMFDLFLCATNLQDKRSKLALSELVVCYGIKALDRLVGNIADAPLGHDSVLLGGLGYTKQPICNWLNLELRGELMYSMPHREIRLFKVIKNPADFNRDFENEQNGYANLSFLMQQASNTLYPTAVEIKTHPGLMTRLTVSLLSAWGESCTVRLGYDYWHLAKEKLGSISFRFAQTGPLNLQAGTKHSAEEGKIFADLGTTFCMERYDVRLVLRGDLTMHHKGIGKSATLGLNVGFYF